MIHVMAAARLGRAAMAPPVMGDDTEALAEKEEHLSVPIVRRERPATAEHDGLTRTPVLVENIGAVPGGDRGHVLDPFRGVGSRASLEEGSPRGPECGTRKDRQYRGGDGPSRDRRSERARARSGVHSALSDKEVGVVQPEYPGGKVARRINAPQAAAARRRPLRGGGRGGKVC